MKKYFFIGLIFCFGVMIGTASADGPRLTQSQKNLIQNLQNQQLISIDPVVNDVYVHSSLWHSLRYDAKEDFSAMLAIYCSDRRGVTAYYISIYDLHSGKKIGKYSQNWGFKVY